MEELPTPESRNEQFLAAVAGEPGELPSPASRKELYLAAAAGMDGITVPTPESREELYLDAIAEGGGGGGGGGGVKPLDPEKVYKETRPSDWLTMPSTIDNNEIYFLLHMPEDIGGTVSLSLNVTRKTNNQTPTTIEFGTAPNGVFTPDPALTITTTASTPSISVPASAYGNTTSAGEKQLIMKISNTGGISAFGFPSSNAATDLLRKQLVEAMVHLEEPNTSTINGLFGSQNQYNACLDLEYAYVEMPNFTDIKSLFLYCESLVAVRKLDIKSVANLTSTFAYCDSLIAIPKFDMKNATIANGMFTNCRELEAVPDLDFSSVTSAANLFQSSGLKKVPSIDTKNVTNFSYMFSACVKLEEIPVLDTSSGTNFSYMFSGCSMLKTIPLLNTTSGTNFSYMFSGCTSLHSVPLLDTSNATSFKNIFYGCSTLKTAPEFNTSKVTDFGGAFYNCYSLNLAPKWDTNKGADFSNMFYNCFSLMYADLSDYDFSSATNMSYMFYGAESLYVIFDGKFPASGIPGSSSTYIVQARDNYVFVRTKITKTDGVLTLPSNASTCFSGSNHYVYVPDDLLTAYQADSKWSTLSTRLKPISEWMA